MWFYLSVINEYTILNNLNEPDVSTFNCLRLLDIGWHYFGRLTQYLNKINIMQTS